MSRFAAQKKLVNIQTEPTPFITKVNIQRILREFPDVFTAIEQGKLSEHEAQEIINTAAEDVRACMLDTLGEIHADLIDVFSSIIVKNRLSGNDIDLGKFSQIMRAAFAVSQSIWSDHIPSKTFNLSDRASIASTIINTATKLQIFGVQYGLNDLHIASITDLITSAALHTSMEILGEKATYKDVHNLAQSCTRYITDVFVESFKPKDYSQLLHEAGNRIDAINHTLVNASKIILDQKFAKPETTGTEQSPSP